MLPTITITLPLFTVSVSPTSLTHLSILPIPLALSPLPPLLLPLLSLSTPQRIGDSLKKETSKGTKTGRFGVGFNSVYHLTDLPTFVSDRFVVMFDPQAKHLPNVNPSNPGKMIDFVKVQCEGREEGAGKGGKQGRAGVEVCVGGST